MMPELSPREIWRAHLIFLLPEFHTAQRLLDQEWIGRDILKYRVIWEGGKTIERRLLSCLAEMNGLASEW